MFYTWACLVPPMFVHSHMFIHPHMFVCPQGCTCLPYALPYSSMPLCFLEALHVVGVVMGFPLCWNTLPYITPVWGCPPLLHPPHSVIGSLCIGIFQGYQYVIWAFPLCQEGFGGVSPISLGLGVTHT